MAHAQHSDVRDNPLMDTDAPSAIQPVAPSPGDAPTAVDDDRFDRAFARAAGAVPTEGNAVRLLLDSRENFPAWLRAIKSATRYVLFESYIIDDDEVGRHFLQVLGAKAREGVPVYVLHDWLGSTKRRALWAELREAGVQVASFNPPSFDSPLAWLARDHRKSIIIDGITAFVSGLC